MQKMTKGAIAAAAAALLLVGGGGTFMSWNDNVTQGNQSITAGNLDLEAASGTWTLNNEPVTTSIDDVRIVPGDTLVFAQEITYKTEGDDLAATLTLSPGAVSAVNGTEGSADLALENELTTNAEISLGALPDGVTAGGDTNTYNFQGDTNGVVNATVTITFPFAPSTNDSRLGKVTLSGMALDFAMININSAT